MVFESWQTPQRSGCFRNSVLRYILPISFYKTTAVFCSTSWRVSLLVSPSLSLLLLVTCGRDNPMQSPLEPPASVSDDRTALVALYDATDGPSWTNSTNWLSGRPIGEWYGVTTNTAGRVTRLVFVAIDEHGRPVPNGLSGNLPPQLGDLVELRELVLPYNSLSGRIPSSLGNLSELRTLDLDYNNLLSGSIPSELGNLSNLTSLYIRGNSLSGSIPPELSNLSNLLFLELGSNSLSGNIPSELGNLSNLLSLDLSGNSLSGSIPPSLGDLSNLTSLFLGGNSLSGSIPSELGNLSDLHNLDLSDNSLTGGIPSSLGNHLGNLHSLSLGENSLSGSVPYSLGNLSNLRKLLLFSNDLSGPLPSTLVKLNRLETLWLDDTQLCVPTDVAFQTWLSGIRDRSEIVKCP